MHPLSPKTTTLQSQHTEGRKKNRKQCNVLLAGTSQLPGIVGYLYLPLPPSQVLLDTSRCHQARYYRVPAAATKPGIIRYQPLPPCQVLLGTSRCHQARYYWDGRQSHWDHAPNGRGSLFENLDAIETCYPGHIFQLRGKFLNVCTDHTVNDE